MQSRIYLSPPHLNSREKEYLVRALESNWITTLGPEVDGFEKELATYAGAHMVVALSSGTAAIHLALKAMGVTAADTVLSSSLTFVGGANPILYQGARPVFVDSDRETWNMCPLALKNAIQSLKSEGVHPKVAIVANLYGQSASFKEIFEICRENQILVLEDAAESLGASYLNQKSGTFGDLSVFSFNGNKIITTSGGGALVCRDTKTAEKIRHWSTQSRDPMPHYEHTEIGFNYRMSNLLAAVGRAQLENLDARVLRRREIFECYRKGLSGITEIEWMPEIDGGYSTRWLSAMILPPQSRDPASIVAAFGDHNIEARRVWKPMHRQPLFSTAAYFTAKAGVSVSDELFDRGLVLPSGTQMTLEDQSRVTELLKDLLK